MEEPGRRRKYSETGNTFFGTPKNFLHDSTAPNLQLPFIMRNFVYLDSFISFSIFLSIKFTNLQLIFLSNEKFNYVNRIYGKIKRLLLRKKSTFPLRGGKKFFLTRTLSRGILHPLVFTLERRLCLSIVAISKLNYVKYGKWSVDKLWKTGVRYLNGGMTSSTTSYMKIIKCMAVGENFLANASRVSSRMLGDRD